MKKRWTNFSTDALVNRLHWNKTGARSGGFGRRTRLRMMTAETDDPDPEADMTDWMARHVKMTDDER